MSTCDECAKIACITTLIELSILYKKYDRVDEHLCDYINDVHIFATEHCIKNNSECDCINLCNKFISAVSKCDRDPIFTQQFLDAIVRLLSLPIFKIIYSSNSYWTTSAYKDIDLILRNILSVSQNLSYNDDAYRVFDTFMYDPCNLSYRQSWCTALFKNKTLPLSLTDTLHVLQYPYMSYNAFYYSNDDIFTITDETLCKIAELGYSDMIKYYWKFIIGSTVNVDRYMKVLFAHGDFALLREYMTYHESDYTIGDLEYVCATSLNVEMVIDIMNNGDKILLNETCIENVFATVDRCAIQPSNVWHISIGGGPSEAYKKIIKSASDVIELAIRSGYIFTPYDNYMMEIHHVTPKRDVASIVLRNPIAVIDPSKLLAVFLSADPIIAIDSLIANIHTSTPIHKKQHTITQLFNECKSANLIHNNKHNYDTNMKYLLLKLKKWYTFDDIDISCDLTELRNLDHISLSDIKLDITDTAVIPTKPKMVIKRFGDNFLNL